MTDTHTLEVDLDKKMPPVDLTDEQAETAAHIAQKLSETEPVALRQIARIIFFCGAEFALKVLEEAFAVEQSGGMTTDDGLRRRTLGGTYFKLSKERMNSKQRFQVLGYDQKRKSPRPAQNQTPQGEPFNWRERRTILENLRNEQGALRSVKATLVGRPGKIENRQNLVITMMEYTPKQVSLPKGVPQPPATPTKYTVYMAAKQWKRVEAAIADPEDVLIVEGIGAYDPAIPGMAVFATSVTTKTLDAAKRGQKPKSENGGSDVPVPQAPVPVEQPPAFTIPANVPAEAASRLTELYTAAQQFQQKIATIEAKPKDQQLGLEMTRKLLTNVEAQIEKLLQEYV